MSRDSDVSVEGPFDPSSCLAASSGDIFDEVCKMSFVESVDSKGEAR